VQEPFGFAKKGYMRCAALALIACLAGCSLTSSGGGECVSDSQCGDDVCTRSGECSPRASVRSVVVLWTLQGAVANATSCNAHPDMFVQFDGSDSGDALRYEQVACVQGQLTVDKLNKRYTQVELGFAGSTTVVQPIDPITAQAQFDLFR
jgi:hypothetical protein